MIIAWTGHRPDEFTAEEVNLVILKMGALYDEYKPEKVIVGGALGVDKWAAIIAIQRQIPFILAIPFEGHHKIWPQSEQDEYEQIKKLAETVVVVCEGGWNSKRDNWKFQKRNEWMVDRCDLLLGMWKGTDGGTANCLRYGIRTDRAMRVIDPRELKPEPDSVYTNGDQK
jgi:uncharacterized phage-like protein YoqJ